MSATLAREFEGLAKKRDDARTRLLDLRNRLDAIDIIAAEDALEEADSAWRDQVGAEALGNGNAQKVAAAKAALDKSRAFLEATKARHGAVTAEVAKVERDHDELRKAAARVLVRLALSVAPDFENEVRVRVREAGAAQRRWQSLAATAEHAHFVATGSIGEPIGFRDPGNAQRHVVAALAGADVANNWSPRPTLKPMSENELVAIATEPPAVEIVEVEPMPRGPAMRVELTRDAGNGAAR